ncbi:MAG: class I adenylate-forming enzyme family protein [Myxococcales bacterium]
MIECPVARAARLRPDAPALVWEERISTYRDLDALVCRWHGALLASGARRAVVRGENRPELVALLHAAARAGVELAVLNARLADAELPSLLDRLGPALRLGALPGATPLEGFEADARRAAPRALDPARVHTLLFTSGTTGKPKAAQLTIGAHQASARASIETLRIDGGSSYLCNLPLFHVGGIATAVRCAVAGATLVLHRRFDAPAAAEALAGGVTHASLVAATLQRLLEARDRFPATVRAVLVGGGPAPAELLGRARAAGLPVLHTYGLTEAASQVTAERLGDADGTTAGWPLPGVDVRVVGGEIEVRGPTTMLGYLGEPPLRDWFRTGDLGGIDARGRLVVHARRSDLIVSGGENVYPAEVEAALRGHPDVVECAVLPWPDEHLGQVASAAVVARRPLDESDLRAHCRARLAGFKVPRRFVLLGALPRTETGKLDRAALALLLREAKQG